MTHDNAIKIVTVKQDDQIIIVTGLAHRIWNEHYTKIIGEAQVAYMLDKFQSFKAISAQITEKGFNYYLIYYNRTPAGYFAFQNQKTEIFLSKLYIEKNYRQKRLGKEAINFIARQARQTLHKRISLTLNKNNTESMTAYKKMGFEIADSMVTDIGNGYVMDDYLLIKQITA